jgi:hypothetical protein
VEKNEEQTIYYIESRAKLQINDRITQDFEAKRE